MKILKIYQFVEMKITQMFMDLFNKGDKEKQMDGVGDTVVSLICISEQLGLKFNDCLDYAYNEIKDRKGKLINGTFVRESDL